MMKTSTTHFFVTLVSALLCAFTTATAQSEVGVGTQVTSESALVSGGEYILQSQASGKPYIVDSGTYYYIPNAGNKATTACVYVLTRQTDGTWLIQGKESGLFWSVPTHEADITPVSHADAGLWKLNFQNGIAYPTALDAGGVERGLDRWGQHLWGYTTGTGITKQVKIYEVGEAPLSDTPLAELSGKVVSVAEDPAADLVTGQWYVMYDRGYTGTNPHGYLYENVSTHTLYNTAQQPSGLATAAARYLVRLSDAADGRYYIQTGFGNYFSYFTRSTVVPVTAKAQEEITVAKIAGTDGHFYLQSASTGIILDANDLSQGDATVVGWGQSAPAAIGGNDDWAFYPVTLEDVGAEVALFAENVQVTRGYQTGGRGNDNALLLRIDLTPSQAISSATFNFSLNAAAQSGISSLYLYETTATEFLANIPSEPLATTTGIGAKASLTIADISGKTHHYWLCATISADAELGSVLEAALSSIDYTTTETVSLDCSTVGNPSRQGMKVFDRQAFVFVPTTDNCRFYRIPAMILDADGNLVLAADKRYNSNADLGYHKIDVVSLRSEDGGRTWQDKATVAVGDGSTAAYYGYGDAALARATNGDLLCLMAAGNKQWGSNATDGMRYAGFAKSSDNGKSWKLTRNLFTSANFYDENSTNGALSMSNIFTTSGKGLTTTDGIVMFTTNCRAMNTSSPNLIYVIYSTDNGEHWRMSNALAYSGGDESKLEQLNDGRLLLSVRQSGNRGWNTATYTKNADGTVTFKWGTQKRTGDIWGNACNVDLVYYGRSTNGEPDLLLHSYINTSGRQSLQLSMSIDQGNSWKDVLNIQPNGSCYSTMVQLPDGDVAIFFEDESYSAGNGYALNFLTITRQQILDMFTKLGGTIPVGIESVATPKHSPSALYDLSGRRISRPTRGIYVDGNKKVVVKR